METDGFDHTSLTCKAFAALLCVSSVAVGCVTLVSALKTQDPIGVYRPDAVRRELPRNGPFMAVETANPHGLHGPGAVSPTKAEFQAHLAEFARKKGVGWLFNRHHRGKGRGGRGKGKGNGRGSLPFGHPGVPSSGLRWRPPSPAAAPHCPPCHSHGPGQLLSSWAAPPAASKLPASPPKAAPD
jgi:hypothetical protein